MADARRGGPRPHTLLILGAAGDLTARLLLPGLGTLLADDDDSDLLLIGRGSDDWLLHGQLMRWRSVRGLRLQTDAQLGEDARDTRSIWRLVAEDPKIELAADAVGLDREAVDALLAFARACLQHASG